MRYVFCVDPGTAYDLLGKRVAEVLTLTRHRRATSLYAKPVVRLYQPGVKITGRVDDGDGVGYSCKAHVRIVVELAPAYIEEACS